MSSECEKPAIPDPINSVQISNTSNLDEYWKEVLAAAPVKPWPERVDGAQLLEEIRREICRWVVLPKWAPETAALWVQHTYAFTYRDITTYLGIESPEHRCGKSTLITVLSELAHRAVVASNVSAPSFFRLIEQVQPTLLIDEADTFLQGNDELRGILNSSYLKKTAFVLRAMNVPIPSAGQANGNGNGVSAGTGNGDNQLALTGNGTGAGTLANAGYNPGIMRFSCWCPKVIARIGSLPVTLADRCIVFRLHRKTAEEKCERLRKFEPLELKQKCLRFALDHAAEIAAAEPAIPPELNDRAADIWEPLFVIADLAGGPWPELARNAAIGVAATTGDFNPIGALLFDMMMEFMVADKDRMFSYEMVQRLNGNLNRPWHDLRRGKEIDERWLARQLSAYGVRPRNVRLDGTQAKGYYREDMIDLVKRYVPKAEMRAFIDELRPAPKEEGTGQETTDHGLQTTDREDHGA